MSTHVRTQLRHRVKALLLGLPTTGARVYRGRRRNLGADHAPCLLVYTDDEDVALDAMAASASEGALQDRQVMLMVEGRANGTEEEALEDLLDAIAAEVEPRIFGNWSFDGLAVTTVLVKTRTRLQGDRAEKLNGGIRLEFRVTYNTAEGAPTASV